METLAALPPETAAKLAFLMVLWLASLNAASWALAGIDRYRWAFGRRRLSETALIWLAVLGGWPGLFHGLRHSTRVRYDYTFRGWLRVGVCAQVVLLGLALIPQEVFVDATQAVARVILPNVRAG